MYKCFESFDLELAVCLLQKCDDNLQIAVNMFLENYPSSAENTVSSDSCISMEVDDAQTNVGDMDIIHSVLRINNSLQAPVVMMSSQCCKMDGEEVANNCGMYIN